MQKVTGHTVLLWLLVSGSSTHAAQQQGIDWLKQAVSNNTLNNPSIASDAQAKNELAYTLSLLDSYPSNVDVLPNDDQSTESLSRALLLAQKSGADSQVLLQALLTRQNADGGFGHLEGWQSGVLDTAIVLLLADNLPSESIKKAIQFLISQQATDGGFYAAGYQDVELLYINAYVLLAANKHIAAYPEWTESLKKLIAYLQAKQLSNGQWSVDNQDLFIEALLNQALHSYRQNMDSATAFSQKAFSLQLGDGSWEDDAYVTSVVLRSLVEQTKFRSEQQITPLTSNATMQIVDKDTGKALSNVLLKIRDSHNIVVSTEQSDNNGHIELVILNQGHYFIELTKDDYTSLSFEVNLQQGKSLELGTINLNKSPNAVLTKIQGKVTNLLGEPIVGAELTLEGTSLKTFSQQDGSYELLLEQVGSFVLKIKKEGFVPSDLAGLAKQGTIYSYSPKLLNIDASYTNFSLLVRGYYGSQLSDVEVLENGQLIGVTNYGNLKINNMLSGKKEFTFRKNGYQTIVVNAFLVPGEVSLEVNMTRDQDQQIAIGTHLINVVNSNDKSTINNYFITAEKLDENNIPRQTQTFQPNLDDVYPFKMDLSAGNWRLTISHPNYNSQVSNVFEVNTTNILTTNIELKPKQYKVVGKVIDSESNRPIPNAVISVFKSSNHSYLGDYITNSSGDFTISNIEDTKVDIEIKQAAYAGTIRQINKDYIIGDSVDLSEIRLRSLSSNIPLADLQISKLAKISFDTDQQNLTVQGVLQATIINKGNAKQNSQEDVQITAFYDDNKNKQLDENELIIGQEKKQLDLDVNAVEIVNITVKGLSLFKDAPIAVAVDTTSKLIELNKKNNIRLSTDDIEIKPFATSLLETEEKWITKYNGSLYGADSMPIAAPLNDTNADGVISKGDIASIIVSAAYTGQYLVINGKTGAVDFTLPNSSHPLTEVVAVANVDVSDNNPEIIIKAQDSLKIYSNTGILKKSIPHLNNPSAWTYPAIHPHVADIDQDGIPEMVLEDYVASYSEGILTTNLSSGVTLALANIDNTPALEIIGSQGITRKDGTMVCQYSQTLNFLSVADVLAIKKPQIIGVANSRIYILDPISCQNLAIYTLPASGGGAPVIADFDGDGFADIGIAQDSRYSVIRKDGSIIWTQPISDGSAGTGSTVFDFDNDSKFEVLHSDEGYLRVFDSTTGQERLKIENRTPTAHEQPIVVDADADGHADIIVVSSQGQGIRMLSGKNNDWANTRNIWNQYSYHVTNINDDLTVPQHEPNSWEVHNTYRANLLLNESSTAAADPSASFIQVTDNGIAAPSVFTVRIGNAGGKAINTGLPVSFYQGNPTQGGVLIGTSLTSRALASGEYEDVAFSYNGTLANFGELYIVANDKGAGSAVVIQEYTASNNTAHLPVQGGYQKLALQTTLDKSSYQSSDALNINSVINNLGSFDAQASLRLSLVDSSNQTLGVLPSIPVALAVQGTVNNASLWPVSGLRKGNYTLNAELYRDDQRVGQQRIAFSVLSDAASTGLLTPHLSSNKKSYSGADTVTLTQQLRNSSTNEVANNVQTNLVVHKADGTVIWQQSRDYAQIAPQILREQSFQIPLLNAAAGEYTAHLTVSADNAATVSSEAQFNVLSTAMTGVGLTGQLQGATDAVWYQDLNYTWQINNQGNSGVNGLPIRLAVINPQTEQLISTVGTQVDVTQQGQSQQQSMLNVPYSTSPLLVLLQVQVGQEWKTLAQHPLTVTKPVVITQITADKSQYGLNDAVVINQVINNQSVVNLAQVKVTTLISQPNGQVVSESSQVVDVNAQSQLPQTVSYTLNRATAGQWQITTLIQDKNGNELNRQVSGFEVLSSALTGEGLTGHLVLPAETVKGQEIAIYWDVKNAGNSPLTGLETRIELVDEQQQVIASLNNAAIDIALDALVDQQTQWTVVGNYNQVLQVRLSAKVGGQWKNIASTAMRVLAPQVSTTIDSNKTSYSFNDVIEIKQHINNQSAVSLHNLKVITQISRPDGVVMDTQQVAVNVLAQSAIEQPISYQFNKADAGQWTITSIIQDEQGVELTRQVKTVEVLSTALTGEGLAGVLQGANDAVWGQTLNYTWQLNNQGNSDLTAMPVRVVVINPQTQIILHAVNATVDIVKDNQIEQQSLVDLTDIKDTVQVLLQVKVANSWKTLAQQPLTVTKPVVTTQITADKAQYGLNDAVVINEVIHNQSVVNLQQVKVTTLITQPNGQVVSESSKVVDVNAQSQLPQTVSYTLNRAAAGQWQITTLIQDKNGIELSRQVSGFEVFSSTLTGEGLTGRLAMPTQAVKGQQINLDWGLSNVGNSAYANLSTRIELLDEQQQIIATLSNSVASLAVDTPLHQQSAWTVAGNYNQVLQARLSANVANQWKTLASANLQVLAPQVSDTLTTNKTSYGFNEKIDIQQQLKNDSSVVLNNLKVTTLISRPDGVVVNSQQATVNLNAASGVVQPVSYQLAQADAGQWTITSIVQDEQGVELTRQVKTVDVQSSAMTGEGINGTLTAAPVEVTVGQDVSLVLALNNQGNAALNQQNISLTITKVGSSTPVKVMTVTVDSLAKGGTITKNANWTVTGQAGDVFSVVATTSFNGQIKTLASASFMAKAAAVAIELTPELAAQSRVLVYYSCGHDWYKGIKGWSFGDCHYSCFDQRASTLRAYLDSLKVSYTLVTKESDFVKAFRSGRYNQTWLLGAIEKLPKDFDEELHEAVHRGDALVTDGGVQTWYNHDIYDIVGVQYRGRLNFSNSEMSLTAPVFSQPQTIGKVKSAGWPLYLKPTTGTVTATYGANYCKSVDKDWIRDKEDEDKEFYGRHQSSYAAMVSNQYGYGKGLSMAFDLIASLDQPTEKTKWLSLLDQSLSWTTPSVNHRVDYVPQELVAVRSQLKNAGTSAQTIRLQVTLPSGAVWMGTGTPDVNRSISQNITLAANSQQQVWLPILLPSLSGTHQLTIKTLSADGQQIISEKQQAFTVKAIDNRFAEVRIAFEQLALNKADDKLRDKVVSEIKDAQYLWSRGRYQEALSELADASAYVREIKGRDVSKERLALDILMKGLSIQWFNNQR